MSGEAHKLQPVVDQLLLGLDEHLKPIHERLGKTDADFIVDGEFDISLRAANEVGVADSIDAFRAELKRRDPTGLAVDAGLEAVDVAVIGHVVDRELAIRRWNPRARNETVPIVHDTVETVRPTFFAVSRKIDETVAWWKNEAPVFATMNGEVTTIYPSNGVGNVVAEVGTTMSYDITARSTVCADFDAGKGVKIHEVEGVVQGIDVDQGSTFKFPILGYKADRHGDPDDFRGALYSRLGFIGEDGSFTQGNEAAAELFTDDRNIYAARVAIELVRSQAEHDFPEVDLSPPGEEFRHKIVEFLATSVIRTFLPGQLTAHVSHGGGSMVGYRVDGVRIKRNPTQIERSTEQEFRAFLTAAESDVEDLLVTTDSILRRMLQGNGLMAQRASAIKAQPGVDAFFETLLV